MGKYSARGRLRRTLDVCEQRTREASPYCEGNLIWIQKMCRAYCRKRRGKFTTEIDLWERTATVTLDAVGSNPMRDWDFLRLVAHQAWRIVPQHVIGSFRVCFEVKLFSEQKNPRPGAFDGDI